MTKKKPVLILFLVFLLLVMIYMAVGAVNKSKEKRSEQNLLQSKIEITQLEGIERISYSNDNTTMAFTKTDGVWKVESDPKFPLNQAAIDTISAQASDLSAVREIKEADALQDYGLMDPKYVLILTDEEGKSTILYVGNAVGEDYYLMKEEDKNVYTVDQTLISSLVFDQSELIQLETYDTIGQSELKEVSVTSNGVSTIYSSEVETDAEKLAGFAGALGSLSVISCADYDLIDGELGLYGLEESTRITVSIRYQKEGQEERNLILHAGAMSKDGTAYYVQTEGSEMVNLVSAETIKTLIQ